MYITLWIAVTDLFVTHLKKLHLFVTFMCIADQDKNRIRMTNHTISTLR